MRKLNGKLKKNYSRKGVKTMKLNHHAALQAIGANQYHHSGRNTEYWTIPASAESKFYDMRNTIPFDNLLSGFREGGFIVYLDKPRVTDALIAAAPDLLAALEALYDAAKHYFRDFEHLHPSIGEPLAIAAAAIAKAKGELS